LTRGLGGTEHGTDLTLFSCPAARVSETSEPNERQKLFACGMLGNEVDPPACLIHALRAVRD